MPDDSPRWPLGYVQPDKPVPGYPEGERCQLCGQVAKGYARINDRRYCHGDDGSETPAPTCYETACRTGGYWSPPTMQG